MRFSSSCFRSASILDVAEYLLGTRFLFKTEFMRKSGFRFKIDRKNCILNCWPSKLAKNVLT